MDDTHFLETSRSIVSVIIPTYNDAHYLGEAIQSVLDQTHQDFEIIVVDDGSKDDPKTVVDAFADPRIQYIRQENKGLSGARNTGIKAATGEYIAFLDADDTFLPNKLADQVTFLQTHPDIGMVAGGWHSIDEQGNKFKTTEPWHNWPNLSIEAILIECPIMVHCVLLTCKAIKQNGLFDETMRWQEDRDFWMRLAVSGCQMAWDKRIVCIRRWHGGNMSHSLKGMSEYALLALDKLYSGKGLSEEVLAVKNKAYATRYAGNAAWFYMAGEYDKAEDNIRQVINTDSSWIEGDPPKITNWLVAVFADSPLVENLDAYMAGLAVSLPKALSIKAEIVRQEVARIYMATVFQSYQEKQYDVVIECLFKGLKYDLSWLLNFGVWSIGLRSVFNKLRSRSF